LASEFQGFCRDLHDEAVLAMVTVVAPHDPRLRQVLALPYRSARKLDRGNAEPGGLGNDFGLLGMTLWPDLKIRYPAKSQGRRDKPELLNLARNGIAHDDVGKIGKIHAAGWTLTLPSIRKGHTGLDGLAGGMDDVVRDGLQQLLKVTPW
jgi:hypothetical protein